MPDQTAGRSDALPPEPPTPPSDSIRLHVENSADSPANPAGDASVEDDTPTIISKGLPVAETAKAPTADLGASLRGMRLAHFELIEPIGVGGMATVLRARDTQLDRIVALKVLPPETSADEENVRRFHQEARAAAKLDHENIARVFFCGEDQKLHFIAFEYVEGENLRELLVRRGTLPVAESVRYVLQIAAGLEHAAARGVVHRDVKPSNIIISPNGRAKLVDMGLARNSELNKDDGLTKSGVTMGTFDYISPEQAIEPREADSRSDLYSLGCTFYHMLTGQPPVPDGTPAKKVHHHQHVPPVDPRRFNAEIPVVVTAILARMMAKDPKDRYQRPVHLVQHLMQVAQTVGAAGDVPEGPLFLDLPMPATPRKRPLLVISSAAAALAFILLVLSLAPGSRKDPFRPNLADFEKPGAKDRVPGPGAKNNVKPNPQGSHIVKSAQDLAVALSDSQTSVHVALKNNIDLGEESLVFKGEGNRTLVIESLDPLEPKTIRFKYKPAHEINDAIVPGLVSGLLLDGVSATFRNVRFEIEADETPNIAVASLGIKGNAAVKFEKCLFAQKDVPLRPYIPLLERRLPIASIGLDNPERNLSERPRVTFDKCGFQGGQSAITIHGPAEVATADCAFMPYGAMFHLRGDCGDHGVMLKLLRCSAFVARGPAFRLDDEATCVLLAEQCIFSCPDSLLLNRDDPQLIRQTTSVEPAVRFTGLRNRYHGLFALWALPGNPIEKMEEFRAEVEKAKGQDTASAKLTVSPWAAADPLKQEFQVAFQLKSDLREVRTPDLKRGLGIESCFWGPMASLPALLPEDDPKIAYKLQPNEKVVDPAADGSSPGVFKTVFQALASAKEGDVLLIKQGPMRFVEVDPIRLDKAGVDFTLRPYPGHEPILRFAQTSEKDASLFRLHDGKIQFERLEFLLEPDQLGFDGQTVVQMGGPAACSFKSCVVTLQPSDKVRHSKRVPLSLVTLIDPEDGMKMPARTGRAAAEIHIEDCFVRGDGDLVTVRASRPLELDVRNSLLGLSGSLLTVTGAAKETPADALASVKLSHVSAFITEPLVVLRAGKNAKGLVPTRVDAARDCLFVALAEKPLVQLEASEATEEGLRNYIDWKGEHNAFVHFDKMFENQRLDDPLGAFRMDSARWAEVYKEPESKFVAAQFQLTPAMQRTLWLAQPDHFLPKSRDEFASFGAVFGPDSLPRLFLIKKAEAGANE